jgi:hypothetical protein
LEKEKVAYQALDNGFLSCAAPGKLQQICDSLGPEDIDRTFAFPWDSRMVRAAAASVKRACPTGGTDTDAIEASCAS